MIAFAVMCGLITGLTIGDVTHQNKQDSVKKTEYVKTQKDTKQKIKYHNNKPHYEIKNR